MQPSLSSWWLQRSNDKLIVQHRPSFGHLHLVELSTTSLSARPEHMTHAEGLFFPPLFFRLSYLSKFHSSPVLRILLYLDCLPFLQSLHHLFALDSAAACGHWPNENRAFISPGGPFCGQITLDTNIPTFDSCPPAAIASKSERKNPTVSSLPSPSFPLRPACYYVRAAPAV